MDALIQRDDGVDLPNFQTESTDVWYMPHTPINSTDAFNEASRLESQAYTANRWFFVAMMVVLVAFVAYQIPYTYIRIRAAPSVWYNFRLLGPRPLELTEKSREAYSAPPHRSHAGEAKPPRRLAHLRSRIPIYQVPFFDLSLSQFLLVVGLWGAGLGVAGWCQARFLTDASRSTLVVMALMSLTAGLGVKAGGIGTWVVYGYTAINFLHRWTGRLVLLLSTLHVIAYLVIFYRDGIAVREMAKPANYLGAVAYGGLCLTGIVSIGFIRKRWWLIFKFGHHLGILLVLAGLNYHSGDIVPYLLAIWGLIVINILVRSITTRLPTATLLALPGADSTLVTFSALTRGFTPGQHVRIRLWSGLRWNSVFESHPFTIASADANGEAVQLVVKVAGDWTAALYQLASQNELGVTVRCSIEGPYGGPINFLFPAFGSVLLVVGGSGVSFGLGVLRGLLNDIRRGRAACKHLTFVWTVRSRDNLEALAPILEQVLRSTEGLDIAQPDFHLDLILCYTGKNALLLPTKIEDTSSAFHILSTMETSVARVRIVDHRPDLPGILNEVIKVASGGGVGVGACGPGQMVEGMEKLVAAVSKAERKRVGGVEMHSERYSL